jgi:outer membrane biosynthesis protein TonB
MTRVAPARLAVLAVVLTLASVPALAVAFAAPAFAQASAPAFVVPPDAVRIAGGVQIPARTKYVAPGYSDALRQAGVRGTVNVETVISPAGKVQDARVVKSVAQLDELALAAVCV